MKLRISGGALLFLSVVLSLGAQTTNSPAIPTTTAQVPRLVRFGGTLKDVNADAVNSVVGVTFSLYAEPTGGAPLWSEVQNVQLDSAGHYSVLLGSTKSDGLPTELFTSAQAQWLGVRVEAQAEQPRVMLLSVPYALKAADAETFGGQPPSAFMSASGSGGGRAANSSGLPLKDVGADHPFSITGSGTTNYVPLWTSPSNLTSSVIYQASNHNVGLGTTTPAAALDVQSTSENGVSGTSTTATGAGITGFATATSGNNIGVFGASPSTTGYGVRGDATSTTGIAYGVKGNASSSSGIGVVGVATATTGTPYGVQGYSFSPNGEGVDGLNTATSGTAFGVHGTSESSGGVGVDGEAVSTTGIAYGMEGITNSSSGVGVLGGANSTTGASSGVVGQNASSSGFGVLGNETSSSGVVYGVKGSSVSPSGFGAAGLNSATTGLAVGVEGQTNSDAGYAVVGNATSTAGDTFGVVGSVESDAGVGVYGIGTAPSAESTTTRPIGVWGDTNGPGAGVVGTADEAVAIDGENNATNSATALFRNSENSRIDAPTVLARGPHYNGYCLFDVSGNLICNGSKSAVVPVDGGTRQVALYAVEAPENWFEDAGSARLSHGSAVVRLESTFAQTINGDMEYHVFLTPKGDCKGLYVTNETPGSFEVRELGGGTAAVAFDYRIMARRKGYESVRLADKTQLFNDIVNGSRSAVVRPKVRRPPVAGSASPVYPVISRGSRSPTQNVAYPVPKGK